jgi:hypothetical protein
LKVVIVVGFFESVYLELEKQFAAQIAEKTVVFVKPAHPTPIPRIADISSRLADATRKASSILLVTARLENYEWIPEKVEQMAAVARSKNTNLEILTEVGKNASDHCEIADLITGFGLEKPRPISAAALGEALGGSKALCVSITGKTKIRDALRRAGFPDEVFDSHFIERIIPTGKNSNLLYSLGAESQHCLHLLYAWDGLRTLDPSVKRKFKGKQYERKTAAHVVEDFKRWVLRKGGQGKDAL